MHKLKRLIREVHRRSLWQVLGIYLVGSWVVLQVVDVIAENMGLPPWTFSFAIVLLLIGLPIVLATAFIQEGIGDRRDEPAAKSADAETDTSPASRQLFNWRNAVVGGVVAFALLAVAVAGWMALGRPGPRSTAAASQASSIAVLPFASDETDEESQAFVNGIHDDLLTQLSKIDSLTVISRTSVMKYRAQAALSIPDIARELGVATVLEGGVRRSGNRVRLNVQLVEAATNRHLWAETYDQELTAANIFEIQADLARKIAGALHARLSPAAETRLAQRPTESLEAYDLVARGRFILENRGVTRPAVEAAVNLYQAAIEADSSYAPAHIGLAQAYMQLFNVGYLTEHEALPRARAAAQKALALDPDLAEAHSLHGSLLRFDGRYQEAERAYLRALELNPGSAVAHGGYGQLLLELGRPEEGVREARRRVELDPLSTTAQRGLLWMVIYAGDYDQGIEEFRKLLELDPEHADAYYFAAIAWTMKGDYGRAIEALRKARELNPDDPYYPAAFAWTYARAGNRSAALAALAEAERMNIPAKESAIVHAALGDLDRAYELLEQAFREEPATLRSLGSDPSAEPLRNDPRWPAFSRRIKPE